MVGKVSGGDRQAGVGLEGVGSEPGLKKTDRTASGGVEFGNSVRLISDSPAMELSPRGVGSADALPTSPETVFEVCGRLFSRAGDGESSKPELADAQEQIRELIAETAVSIGQEAGLTMDPNQARAMVDLVGGVVEESLAASQHTTLAGGAVGDSGSLSSWDLCGSLYSLGSYVSDSLSSTAKSVSGGFDGLSGSLGLTGSQLNVAVGVAVGVAAVAATAVATGGLSLAALATASGVQAVAVAAGQVVTMASTVSAGAAALSTGCAAAATYFDSGDSELARSLNVVAANLQVLSDVSGVVSTTASVIAGSGALAGGVESLASAISQVMQTPLNFSSVSSAAVSIGALAGNTQRLISQMDTCLSASATSINLLADSISRLDPGIGEQVRGLGLQVSEARKAVGVVAKLISPLASLQTSGLRFSGVQSWQALAKATSGDWTFGSMADALDALVKNRKAIREGLAQVTSELDSLRSGVQAVRSTLTGSGSEYLASCALGLGAIETQVGQLSRSLGRGGVFFNALDALPNAREALSAIEKAVSASALPADVRALCNLPIDAGSVSDAMGSMVRLATASRKLVGDARVELGKLASSCGEVLEPLKSIAPETYLIAKRGLRSVSDFRNELENMTVVLKVLENGMGAGAVSGHVANAASALSSLQMDFSTSGAAIGSIQSIHRFCDSVCKQFGTDLRDIGNSMGEVAQRLKGISPSLSGSCKSIANVCGQIGSDINALQNTLRDTGDLATRLSTAVQAMRVPDGLQTVFGTGQDFQNFSSGVQSLRHAAEGVGAALSGSSEQMQSVARGVQKLSDSLSRLAPDSARTLRSLAGRLSDYAGQAGDLGLVMREVCKGCGLKGLASTGLEAYEAATHVRIEVSTVAAAIETLISCATVGERSLKGLSSGLVEVRDAVSNISRRMQSLSPEVSRSLKQYSDQLTRVSSQTREASQAIGGVVGTVTAVKTLVRASRLPSDLKALYSGSLSFDSLAQSIDSGNRVAGDLKRLVADVAADLNFIQSSVVRLRGSLGNLAPQVTASLQGVSRQLDTYSKQADSISNLIGRTQKGFGLAPFAQKMVERYESVQKTNFDFSTASRSVASVRVGVEFATVFAGDLAMAVRSLANELDAARRPVATLSNDGAKALVDLSSGCRDIAKKLDAAGQVGGAAANFLIEVEVAVRAMEPTAIETNSAEPDASASEEPSLMEKADGVLDSTERSLDRWSDSLSVLGAKLGGVFPEFAEYLQALGSLTSIARDRLQDGRKITKPANVAASLVRAARSMAVQGKIFESASAVGRTIAEAQAGAFTGPVEGGQSQSFGGIMLHRMA